MSAIFKIGWVLRYLGYKLLLGSCKGLGYFGKPLFLHNPKNIFVNNNVRIFPYSRMETHNGGKITFCQDVSIGQSFHIISSRLNLVIGKGTLISGNVFISNIDHQYENPKTSVAVQPLLSKETQIGENCFIGYGAVIQAGTLLGNHCIVGANSVVRGQFDDFCVLVGAPAKVVKRYCHESSKWIRVN